MPIRHSIVHDLTGQTFGFITVIRFARKRVVADSARGTARRNIWLCRCNACGNEREFPQHALTSASPSKSCGCRIPMLAAKQMTTHGEAILVTPEYKAWQAMLTRCNCKSSKFYKHYGGRGIKVCDQWLNSFETFLRDVGRRPSKGYSLDRFPDNNGNYEPGNVRWATKRQQSRNTRTNHLIDFRGHRRSLAEWAELLGMSQEAFGQRIKKWSLDRAMTEKPRRWPSQQA